MARRSRLAAALTCLGGIAAFGLVLGAERTWAQQRISPVDKQVAADKPTTQQEERAGALAAAAEASLVGGPSQAPPPTPRQPLDAVGAKAFAVFKSYCASCHQQPNADGGFGIVLDLEKLAGDRSLVRPGVPDASRLYQIMLARHAPMRQGRPDDPEPSPLEVASVREWIEALVVEGARCPDRKPIDSAELANTMQRWLEQSKPEAAKSTRFISLAHLYNACATDADIAASRQAVQKLLNGLSWAPTPVRIEAVGDALAVLAFRLSDIGWVPAHWDRLAALEPVGGAVPASQTLQTVTGSPRPVLRADWLAWAASRAPLYYELLGLPDRLPGLTHLLGLSLEAGTGPSPRFMRAGLKTGNSLHAPVVAERHVAKDGQLLWLAYEWAGTVPATELIENPLAPYPANGKAVAKPETIRMMLALPNGFLTFAAFNGDGARVDAAPIAGHTSQSHAISAGCLSCHAAGLQAIADEVRSSQGAGREAKERGLAAYPAAAELAKVFDNDNYRYRRALVQAGVDPDLRVDGVEIIAALARRYQRPLDIDRAATEAGIAIAELQKRLAEVEGELKPLAQRLLFDLLPRSEAELLLAALRHGEPGQRPPAAQQPPNPTSAISIGLWTDKLSYRAGDLVRIAAQPGEDCYLTIIDVDTSGRATILFPNDFDQDNLVPAGTILRVPGDKAPFQLRLNDRGTETFVAICSTVEKLPPAVKLDFDRQRFPSLGLWRTYLQNMVAADQEARRNLEKARNQPTKPVKSKAEPTVRTDVKLRQDAHGRAAIVVRVE